MAEPTTRDGTTTEHVARILENARPTLTLAGRLDLRMGWDEPEPIVAVLARMLLDELDSYRRKHPELYP